MDQVAYGFHLCLVVRDVDGHERFYRSDPSKLTLDEIRKMTAKT